MPWLAWDTMPENPDYLRQAQIVLFVQWVFFNTLGWAVGILLLFAVREVSAAYAIYGLFAFTLGIGQWVVLRRYLHWPSPLWIPLTVIGFIVAQLTAQTMTDFILPAIGGSLNNMLAGVVFGGLIGIVLGLVVGVFQYPLLPHRYAPARYWILANIVGWGFGFQLSALLPGVSFQVTSLLSAIVNGCLTGLWVMQLLNDEV